jgi:hypothetical protein
MNFNNKKVPKTVYLIRSIFSRNNVLKPRLHVQAVLKATRSHEYLCNEKWHQVSLLQKFWSKCKCNCSLWPNKYEGSLLILFIFNPVLEIVEHTYILIQNFFFLKKISKKYKF